MYTALLIMFSGIILGRIFRQQATRLPIRQMTLGAILLLLFLLGVSIGSDDDLCASLPTLGWQALVLMLLCVGGSIVINAIITPFLKIPPQQDKDAR